MTYQNIVVETNGRVGVIRLNRPQALNALNKALMAELTQAIEAFDADDKVGCLLIVGSDKAFAAGADIKEMADKPFIEAYLGDFVSNWNAAAHARKPIVAAVAGFALGGGCELAMQCDIVIAAETRSPAAVSVICAWAVAAMAQRLTGHDRLRGQGQVQDEFAVALVKLYRARRVRAALELAWPAVPETAAAVANPDLPDAGPLPGEAGAHRDAQLAGAGRGVGIARHRERAGVLRRGGQEAPGHRLITLGPAPVRAGNPVEHDQFQRPGGGAFGQHGQVPGGNPAVPAPHEPVVGQRLAGQERADPGCQVLGPFQG